MQRYTADYYHKWLHLLQDFSIILLHDVLWLGVYFFLEMYMTKECQIWLGIIWIAAIHSVVFLLRHFCHKLLLLLLGHGALYGLVLLLAKETNYLGETETIFCLLMLTGCLIESIQRWRSGFSPSMYYVRWYFFPEPFILYFYGLYANLQIYRTVAVVLAIIFLMGHFWCLYLQGMNDYLDQHMQSEKIPRSSILRMNTKVIMGILLIFLAALISFAALRFDFAFFSIGHFLADFFRIFISGLQGLIRALSWWKHSSTDGVDHPSVEEVLKPTEPPAVSGDDGSEVYLMLGVIISLIIFFYMVYRLAHAFDDRDNRKWIPPEFGSRLRMDDQVEDLGKKERKLFHLFRTNREKIRYQFKKRVKKAMKGAIPKAYTAWDFHEEIQKKQADENMTVLTGLYDVARYGEREITSAEVKKCTKRF